MFKQRVRVTDITCFVLNKHDQRLTLVSVKYTQHAIAWWYSLVYDENHSVTDKVTITYMFVDVVWLFLYAAVYIWGSDGVF